MSTEPSPAFDGENQTPDERHRQQQRRKQRRTVLAVALAVLVAGGGGAYWATTAGSDEGSAAADGKAKPPRLALDGLGKGEQAGDGGGGSGKGGAQNGILPGEPTNARKLEAAPGTLPDNGPDSAAVRRPVQEVSRAQVAKLAEALHVPGTPEKGKDRWTVGTPGKSGKPSLTVDTGAFAGNWTYAKDGSAAPVAKGEPVPESEAKDAAAPALKALDLPGAKVSAGTTAGGQRVVQASPRIAGLPVQGWDSTFTVGPKGELLRGQGNLGRTTKGPDYPLLSAEKTLKELNKQRPQPKGGHQQDPAKVSKAELGLARHQSHGKPVLVPSWLYTVDAQGGGSPEPMAHPAVNPEYLDAAPGQGPMLPHPVKPGKPDEGSGQGKDESPGDPGGKTGDAVKQAVNSYEADGRTLKLTFWAGVCDTYKATADESGDAVRVTVRPEHPDQKKVCVKMAKRQTVEVKLDKPLGDRKVVDSREDKTLPRH